MYPNEDIHHCLVRIIMFYLSKLPPPPIVHAVCSMYSQGKRLLSPFGIKTDLVELINFMMLPRSYVKVLAFNNFIQTTH